MELIFELYKKNENPFFSVCIETHNRGKTIFRALESLLHQGKIDFECVVVDDCSSDNTIDEIKKFSESTQFNNSPYPLKLYKTKKHLGGVLNWNSPLTKAAGKYVACLEGDDYYMDNYLQKAHGILQEKDNIGVYSTGSQRALRPKVGYLKSTVYFKYLYQLENISPPSETIFIRLNKQGVPYLYDVETNTYAPEMKLLLTIASDGWDAFHTSEAEVYREPSTSNTNLTWKYFDDKFRILEHFRHYPEIDEKQVKSSFIRQIKLATRRYLYSDSQQKGNSEGIKEGILNVLKSKKFPGTGFANFFFKTILFLKSIGFFKIYYAIKNN